VTKTEDRFLHHPATRTSDCGAAGALHNGHSGFCAHQLATHAQQKTCPHGVAAGASCGDKHRAHFFWSRDDEEGETENSAAFDGEPSASRVSNAKSTVFLRASASASAFSEPRSSAFDTFALHAARPSATVAYASCAASK
jgi:hypothetical protein